MQVPNLAFTKTKNQPRPALKLLTLNITEFTKMPMLKRKINFQENAESIQSRIDQKIQQVAMLEQQYNRIVNSLS